MGEEAFDKAPLLVEVSNEPDRVGGGIVRTGTQWSATAHIITAVIGSGVLSLAWSVGQLGWIGGPTALIAFAAVTSVQSSLLADCYKSPDPEYGPIRNRSYMEAVSLHLGEKSLWVCGFFQQTGLFGSAVAYNITSGNSMSDMFFWPPSELKTIYEHAILTKCQEKLMRWLPVYKREIKVAKLRRLFRSESTLYLFLLPLYVLRSSVSWQLFVFL